jgi:hypothetical protein
MPSVTAAQAALARETPLANRITVRYHEAAMLTGLPLTKLGALVTSGVVKSAKIGRTRLIDTASLIKVNAAAQVEPVPFKDGRPDQPAKKRKAAR